VKYFFVFTGLSLALAWALEVFYFAEYRKTHNPQATNEAFLNEGRLGDILLDNAMLNISEDSYERAIQDDCAKTGDLSYGDFLHQFKIRAQITAPKPTPISLSAIIGTPAGSVTYTAKFVTDPKRSFYDLNYKAAPGESIYIKYAARANTEVTVVSAKIQARFTTLEKDILVDGTLIDTVLSSFNGKTEFDTPTGTGLLISGKKPEMTQYLPPEFRNAFYAAGLPRRESAFCTYVVNRPSAGKNSDEIYDKPRLLPRVTINTEEDNLYGERGILNNKHGKGRWWEKPATLSVSNQHSIINQKVSLRFHGGGPGRKKTIESFRVYARKKFGASTINASAITGKQSTKNFKTLVFKYTFQSLATQDIDFNPFIHSLALDIADQIGAIVPRHHLVDLTINDQHKGLYLAMEHLSDRTIAKWLGHDDFYSYTYKASNTLQQSVPVFKVAGAIREATGEETLKTLEKYMDINNVLNSILLTAYIGDEDYCQGVELTTPRAGPYTITSINWDLDHAFFSSVDDQPHIDPNKYGFRPIRISKKTGCVKQWMFGWTYMHSAKFRALLRARMEELLETNFSPENAIKLLDYYKELDAAEFSGRYAERISELEVFLKQRGEILRKQLSTAEHEAETVDISQSMGRWKRK